MRKIVLFFLFFSTQTVFSQQFDFKYFTLQDGDLDSGSVMIRHDIYFDFNKATLRPEDSIPLKAIADWLIYHAEFTIEINQHADIQNPQMSSNLTAARANSIMKRLIEYGVPSSQLLAKGYGATRNVIPQSFIAKEPSLAKKDSLRAINRRTEFKIIAVHAKYMKIFSLNDSVFCQGQILRDHGKITFDFNKAGLRPESQLFLDTLVAFLKSHPTIKLEVACHTDQRGSWHYNIKLSHARANSIMAYLISKGIDPLRLRSKGFGESQPVFSDGEILLKSSPAEKEELYQQNRRTEFKIISVK